METFDSFVDLMASMFHASMPELQLWTQTASTLSNIQVLISRAKIDEANVGKLLEETKFYETLKARREIIIGGQSVMEPDIQLFVIIETFWELTYSQFNPPENAQSSVGLVTLPRGDVSNTQYLTELMGELRNAQVAYPECLADWRLNSAVRQIALPLDRAIDLNNWWRQ